MKKATNAIAEQVAKMQQENWSHSNSLVWFQEAIDKNNAAIAELEPLATWEEIPDEVTP